MDVLKIIKFAFVVAALMYAVVAVMVSGPPDWSRPLLPEPSGAPLFYGLLFTLAVADWIAGFVLGHRAEPPALLRSLPGRSWPQTRLVIAAALTEAGALFGLILALLFKDSRPALLTSGISAILLLWLPTSSADRSPG